MRHVQVQEDDEARGVRGRVEAAEGVGVEQSLSRAHPWVWLGAELWEGMKDVILGFPGFNEAGFDAVSAKLAGHTFFWIFVAGFTPLPFKLFAVTAGVMHEQVEFWVFLAAAASSRTLRFLLEVWLIRLFGPTVLDWLERRTKLVLLLTLLVIAAYYLLRS